jgi:hypothetical protein
MSLFIAAIYFCLAVQQMCLQLKGISSVGVVVVGVAAVDVARVGVGAYEQ